MFIFLSAQIILLIKSLKENCVCELKYHLPCLEQMKLRRTRNSITCSGKSIQPFPINALIKLVQTRQKSLSLNKATTLMRKFGDLKGFLFKGVEQ